MKSTRSLYEKRKSDYTYRTDGGGRVVLQCSPHMHYHLELVYMTKGSVKAFVDYEEYEINEGDIFLVFPNKVHRFISRNRKKGPDGIVEGCEQYMLFIVNPDLMPELTKQIQGMTPENPLLHPNTDELYGTLSLLARFSDPSRDDEPGVDLVRRGYLLAFFSNLLSQMNTYRPKTAESPAMQLIVDYCAANYQRELSLDVLEKELHISKYYISHLFGNRMNMHFNEYINSLRISEACRYLRGSDKSIGEIGELVGFGTQRTFNRAFSKQMGVTPGEYRKNKSRSFSASMPM